MIVIIHGDNTAASRTYFIEQKKTAQDAVSFQGETVTLTDLVQAIEGGGLFSDEKILFIEHFFSEKKGKELDALVSFLDSRSDHITLYLWEEKKLTKAQIGTFKHAQDKLFAIPQTLFQFLDALKPGNGQTLIQLFHQTQRISEPELIFFMMIRQFRLMLALCEPTDNAIDEVKRLAPWQIGKLGKQANLFGKEKLIANYQRLHEIDLGSKSGTLNMPLPTAIDFFLLEL